MENYISVQVAQVIISLGLGIVLGYVYDFFRAIRILLKEKVVEIICDILFSLITLFCLFYEVITIGQGEIRFFMLLAVIAGISIYNKLVSSVTMSIFMILIARIRGLFAPIVNILKKYYVNCENHFTKLRKSIKIERLKSEYVTEEIETKKGRYTY